jgi:hypothetical protein
MKDGVFLWQPKHGTNQEVSSTGKRYLDLTMGLGAKFSCGATSLLIISSPYAAIMIHLPVGLSIFREVE